MEWTASFLKRLRRTLVRRGRTTEDAEDLVQEACLRFEETGARRRAERPEAFITRTAFNLAIDEDRRKSRRPMARRPLADYELVDFSPDASEILDAKQRLHKLAKGLDALSSRSRRILLAQRLEGLSHAEIAKQEGITLSAVEKQLSRTLLFLAEWMDK